MIESSDVSREEGWYPDPFGNALGLLYWDGSSWGNNLIDKSDLDFDTTTLCEPWVGSLVLKAAAPEDASPQTGKLSMRQAWNLTMYAAELIESLKYYSQSELKCSLGLIRFGMLTVGGELVTDSVGFFDFDKINELFGYSEYIESNALVYGGLRDYIVENEELAELLNRGKILSDKLFEEIHSIEDIESREMTYSEEEVFIELFISRLSDFDKKAYEEYDKSYKFSWHQQYSQDEYYSFLDNCVKEAN